MCHELEPLGFDEIICHGFWTMGFDAFCVNMGSFGLKKDFPKFHDNVDVVRVANEIKPCGMKILSSTPLNIQNCCMNVILVFHFFKFTTPFLRIKDFHQFHF